MNREEKIAALDAVNAKLSKDFSLPLKATALNDVPGEGDVDAEVLLVGEAPGKREDELARPFVGASGKLLDALMESIGLNRESVFIANLIKHRPPGNRDPLPEEIAAYTPYLEEQLAIIQPRIIITLGRFSMQYFLGEGQVISKIHGQPKRNKQGRVIMPMYHPAAALYSGNLRPVLFADFAKIPKVIELLDSPKPAAKESEYTPQEDQKPLL